MARYAYARRYPKDGGRWTPAAEPATDRPSSRRITVTGLDVAPQAVEFARANYPIPNLRFVVSSCATMPFPANAFDLVVAFEVIEHLPNPRAFLHECARVFTQHGAGGGGGEAIAGVCDSPADRSGAG